MPEPLDAITSARLRRQGRRDTEPELQLRRALLRRGLRYRIDRSPLPGMRTRADVLFIGAKVAVFVDGCFWHGCPDHATAPKNNASWWREKLEMNAARDRRVDGQLRARDWESIRVWEHEDPEAAADRILAVVTSRRRAKTSSASPPETIVARSPIVGAESRGGGVQA